MRVLIVSHTYAVPIRRGKIALLAKDPRYEIGLLVPKTWSVGFDQSKGSELVKPSYKLFSLPTFFNGDFNRYFFEPFSLLGTFIRFRPQLVQVEQEPWSYSLFQVAILAKLFRSRVLFFTWENIFKDWRRLFGFLERVNLRLADGAIVGNSEAAEVLKRKGFAKPIKLIPQTGVDPDVFRRREREGKKGVVIGFVGRFDEAKGIMDLLAAFAKLVERDNDIRWLLLGGGPLADAVREVVRQHRLANKVKIVDAVPPEEVPRYMSRLDILVVPSKKSGNFWKEQFGRVIIEAMACEAVVLGSSSGAIPEVIGEAGFVFEEGDREALFDGMLRLVKDDSLRMELGRRGRERVLKNYTNEVIAKKTKEFWE